ncbi:hypothetical protein UZ36_05475 [Candidatus Nitromaritima sp. SCGC AAA799-C22]|nr:hypothetical protein UZ36_05475 [Candidatus Nitromaritima sp. SCGC AAA799-C22]
MVSPVKCVKPNASLKEVISLLVVSKFHGIPVVDEDHSIVGIITEKDVLLALSENKEPGGTLASEIMSRDVITADKSALVVAVVKKMLSCNVTRIPITEGPGKVVGIVTQHDIIKELLDSGVTSLP